MVSKPQKKSLELQLKLWGIQSVRFDHRLRGAVGQLLMKKWKNMEKVAKGSHVFSKFPLLFHRSRASNLASCKNYTRSERQHPEDREKNLAPSITGSESIPEDQLEIFLPVQEVVRNW